MTIDERTSLTDVAFEVGTALHECGVTAVLTGGSAATFHAPEAYQSRDLDFVIEVHAHGAQAERALERLGYRREGNVYRHALSPLLLEFPPGPLMVGRDPIERWDTHRRGRQVLNVITATDSCRDRLAAYYFWRDWSGLEQALAVARARRDRVDLDRIASWSRVEGNAAGYDEFSRRLNA